MDGRILEIANADARGNQWGRMLLARVLLSLFHV
jgi:hypothetical protein